MNIVERAKSIIVTPKTDWLVVAAEESNIRRIVTEYVLPLALIPAIASIIGLGLIGRGMMASFGWGVAMGLIQFIAAFVGVYVSAFVVHVRAGEALAQEGAELEVEDLGRRERAALLPGLRRGYRHREAGTGEALRRRPDIRTGRGRGGGAGLGCARTAPRISMGSFLLRLRYLS